MIDPNDPGAGAPGSPSLDNSDLGNPGGEGNSPQGTPSGQDGSQPNPGVDELTRIKQENRALNRALVEAKRGQRQQPANPQGGDYDPFTDPAGQYAISLQLATGELRGKLEDIVDLYPEIPASEIVRIRRNPWAFASYESYRTGDWQTALLEIEQSMLDRAEEINAANAGNQPSNPKPNPATLNNNPAGEPASDAEPGSEEDENPWTMPLGKLEKRKNKELAKQAQTNP